MPPTPQHVLNVQPGGIVEGLFTEDINLSELGPLHITRSSTIEFNATIQQWEVRVEPSHQRMFTHPSRQACLDWEREHFNAAIAAAPPKVFLPDPLTMT
jgi:hypothetical protein